MTGRSETDIGSAGGRIQPTAWTQVLAARDGTTGAAREALDGLIRAYWKPVYFHVRRKGHDADEAKDLTQGFFVSLLEREAFRSVDPEKGRFRTFLRACLEHYLSKQYARRDAAKRKVDWAFHYRKAEETYVPERAFERDWALAVLERSCDRLRDLAPREARVVEAQIEGAVSMKDLAAEFGTSEGNVKVMAHRGRKRLRAILLEELSATLADPSGAEAELSELFRSISL